MRAILGIVWCLISVAGVGCSSSSSGYHTSGTTESGHRGSTECSVEGRWVGMIPGGILAGRMVDLTFYPNGMARGTSGSIVLDQSWQREGDVISIVHVNAIPPAAACRVDYVGRYSLTFEEACNAVIARSIEDLCEHRRRTLDGLRARRQP